MTNLIEDPRFAGIHAAQEIAVAADPLTSVIGVNLIRQGQPVACNADSKVAFSTPFIIVKPVDMSQRHQQSWQYRPWRGKRCLNHQ
jgi:hypothetical protein